MRKPDPGSELLPGWCAGNEMVARAVIANEMNAVRGLKRDGVIVGPELRRGDRRSGHSVCAAVGIDDALLERVRNRDDDEAHRVVAG